MLIGLTGKMGSGKSTVASLICQLLPNSRIAPIAQSLKDIALWVGWDGKKDATGRKLLQDLGSAVRTYNEDAWIKLWREQAKATYLKKLCGHYIIDDVRYENEADMIRSMCGSIIHVVRSGVIESAHHSEAGIAINNRDVILDNNGTLSQLGARIKDLLNCCD